MPDVTEVMARLTKVEMEQGAIREAMNKKFKDVKADHDKYADGIREKLSDFNIRITKLENVEGQAIDYDELFDRDEFKSLKRQIQMVVDNTSVNAERLVALENYNEKTLRPLLNEDFGPRIVGLEDQMALLEADLTKKLDKAQLDAELEKKADVESLDYLRQGIEKVNEVVNDFMNTFAEKA